MTALDLYCDEKDLYLFGVTRGAIPNPGRLASHVDVTDDLVFLDSHGYSTGDRFTVRAEAGGQIPAPLVEGTEYEAVSVTGGAFSVRPAGGGAVIDLTTPGVSFLVIEALPVEAARDWASRIIDDMLPAHVVPLESPYPRIVVMSAAEIAAAKLMRREGLPALVDEVHARLARWAKHVPVRGRNEPAGAQLAQSVTAPYKDRRGWNTHGRL